MRVERCSASRLLEDGRSINCLMSEEHEVHKDGFGTTWQDGYRGPFNVTPYVSTIRPDEVKTVSPLSFWQRLLAIFGVAPRDNAP